MTPADTIRAHHEQAHREQEANMRFDHESRRFNSATRSNKVAGTLSLETVQKAYEELQAIARGAK